MTVLLDENTVQILTAYAEGDVIADIVKDTGLSRTLVSETLSDRCGYNRDRARQIVQDNDEEPLVWDRSESEPEPTSIRVGHWAALLDEAEATGDRRLIRMAGQVRDLLANITERLEDIRADRAARAEVARLEAELANARAQLRARGARPVSPAEPPSKAEQTPAASTSEIRAWAIGQGLEVAPKGVLPASVVQAFNDHHGSAA